MVRIKAKCDDNCDCQTRIIAKYTTSRDNPVWDLTPYQGAGIGMPNTYWRLVERDYLLEYNRGKIDESGTLVGLPNEFRSTYIYEGFMELQQGCSNPCCTPSVGCEDDVSWP